MLYTTFVIILDCVHILFRFFLKKFSGLFFLCHDSKFLLERLCPNILIIDYVYNVNTFR